MPKVEVRFSDIDSQGHANHLSVLEWIAHCRVKLIDERVDRSGIEDIDHVLVSLEAEFLGEIFYPGNIEVCGQILSVGNKSVTTSFFVYRNDSQVLSDAKCVNVFFDSTTKKTIPIPDELRTVLELEVENFQ